MDGRIGPLPRHCVKLVGSSVHCYWSRRVHYSSLMSATTTNDLPFSTPPLLSCSLPLSPAQIKVDGELYQGVEGGGQDRHEFGVGGALCGLSDCYRVRSFPNLLDGVPMCNAFSRVVCRSALTL